MNGKCIQFEFVCMDTLLRLHRFSDNLLYVRLSDSEMIDTRETRQYAIV